VKWIEARVVYERAQRQPAADLISDVFYDLGVPGVVLEDPEVEPVSGWAEADWWDNAPTMPTEHAVVGYFPQDSRPDEKCRILRSKLGRLAIELGIATDVRLREIDETDWSETWKDHFGPLRITDRITVKPTWHPYTGRTGETVIEIDPGMAFGTGTHPTTSLCIQMIEKYLVAGMAFLDIGTGSGILLITAAKLGAATGLGVDLDEDAIAVSRRNLEVNSVDPKAFAVRAGSYAQGIDMRFGLVVANLLPNAVLTLLDSVGDVLSDAGVFVCLGLLEMHRDPVLEEMARKELAVLDIRSREGWLAIAGTDRRS